jgi:hypothetical protein
MMTLLAAIELTLRSGYIAHQRLQTIDWTLCGGDGSLGALDLLIPISTRRRRAGDNVGAKLALTSCFKSPIWRLDPAASAAPAGTKVSAVVRSAAEPVSATAARSDASADAICGHAVGSAPLPMSGRKWSVVIMGSPGHQNIAIASRTAVSIHA